jgi:hypothetical protein
MRLLGTIPHPFARIQVFQYGNRFSLKVEAGAYEQNFKFRESPLIQTIDDVIRLADDAFIQGVMSHFDTLHHLTGQAWERFAPVEAAPDEWEEVI